MVNDEGDEVIQEFFKSLLSRYQISLETSMKGSNFVFDYVDFLYCKYHKVNLRPGGSYSDSPYWIKIKKATINPKNNDGKYFQYPAMLALNHKEIGKHPERISKVKPFQDK